jgi:hypothetical protein
MSSSSDTNAAKALWDERHTDVRLGVFANSAAKPPSQKEQ